MRVITLEEPYRLSLRVSDFPGDSLAAGDALVRVRRVGVCGTDIHAYQGRQPFFTYPRVLGHELGVEVIAVGEGVSGVKPGDYCAVEPTLNCQMCIACRQGKGNCCTCLRVLGVHVDGGMREQLMLPARKLHPSERLSLDQLALVEPLGIGCHAVERAKLVEGEFVLVIGAGPIGLAVVQFALATGAQVIVMDVNESRLEFSQKQLGVAYTINSVRENALEVLQKLTGGDLPTAVFDATGNPVSMVNSFDYPAHGGRLVFVGLFQGDVHFNDPQFHRRELTLMGSRNASSEDFPQIIKLIERGRIDTTPWITHRGQIGEVPERFLEWMKPETAVLKAMIEIV